MVDGMVDDMVDSAVIEKLKSIVGPKGWESDAGALEPYLTEWRGLWHGKTPLMLRPATSGEVSEIVRVCADADVTIVPQGGNTSLCGGSVPHTGDEILVNLSRMNAIRDVDPANATMTAEAGCILAHLQQRAADAGRLFPLSFAAEGSAEVGGFLSTNAGGVNVLRYGNARDLVLGLEVVLPDGRVWNGLRTLRKDNTGYDLKHLFIGAEGTLGVITAATFKLFPRPRSRVTAFLGIGAPEDAIALLSLVRERSGDMVSAFELMSRFNVELVLKHMAGNRDPLENPQPWYVLMDLTSGFNAEILSQMAEDIFAEGMDQGLVRDGVIASSQAQADELWRLRHGMSEAQKWEGASIKHDVSVPVSRIPRFIEEAEKRIRQAVPGCRPAPFGHVGDGNMHFNITQPEGMDGKAFIGLWNDVNDIVHAVVTELGGSISAEHGIGVLKRELLPRYKSAVEMDLMRSVKKTLDPKGIMNPGKVL